MKIADAKRAARLIKTMDEAKGYLAAMTRGWAKKHPYVKFDIWMDHGTEGRRTGFEGELTMDRAVAVKMLRGVVAQCDDDLRALGVT